MARLVRLATISFLAVIGLMARPSSRVIAADNPASKSNVDEVGWTQSYDDALTTAKAEKKLVLADFTGSDWCHFCVQLKKEVLDTADFKNWAADHVVLLELDYPQHKKQSDELKKQNARLKNQFKITGFPTVIIMNADGKEEGRLVGYGGAKDWSVELQKIDKRAR
jgi:protein disulfide-isomerase